jgi:hypothetical protein
MGRPGSSAAGSIAEGAPPPAGEFWAAGLDRGCTCILVPGEMTRRNARRMMLAGGRASDCDRMLVPHPKANAASTLPPTLDGWQPLWQPRRHDEALRDGSGWNWSRT